MSTFLWIVQIILVIKLLTVTLTHGLRQSADAMRQSAQKMGSLAPLLHTFVAGLALLGSLGLVLPGVLSLPSALTPLAAAIAALFLLASMPFHLRTRDKPNLFVSVILALLAVFVAYGRWALAPF
jgi:predicted branched-subunit amino acid permease